MQCSLCDTSADFISSFAAALAEHKNPPRKVILTCISRDHKLNRTENFTFKLFLFFLNAVFRLYSNQSFCVSRLDLFPAITLQKVRRLS